MIALGSMDLLLDVGILTHEQEMSSFVCVFFNFSHQSLILFSIQIFNFLVKFISKYCIVFYTILNEIFSLFSNGLLFMYWNTLIAVTDFVFSNFIEIIYYKLAAFWREVASLGFLYITSCHSNRNHLISFILVLDATCGIINGGREVSSTMFRKWNVHIPKKKKRNWIYLTPSQKNSLKWTGD